MTIQDFENSITVDTDLKSFVNSLDSSDLKKLNNAVLRGRFCVKIPVALKKRANYSEMNAYKLVLLINLFERLFPSWRKNQIYETIKMNYGYFITYRQFNNIIKKWKDDYKNLER